MRFDLVCLGEALIDFTQVGFSERGMRIFERNPGGAPLNVAVAASECGLDVAFMGSVGEDMFGNFLIETLESKGIYTRGVVCDKNYFTTLAFVELNKSGERKFSFARKPGADTRLAAEDIDKRILLSSKALHFGSLSLSQLPARDATYYALRIARENGVLISYDANYRESLWESEQEAILRIRDVLSFVDIIKLSEEEIPVLTDKHTIEAAGRELIARGIKVVCITRGGNGATVFLGDKYANISCSEKIDVVDTTGAGDAFWGGFLARFIKDSHLTIENLAECATEGNRMAANCISHISALDM